MKATIKSIMAVGALVAAGAANATTWNVDMYTNTNFPAANGPLIMDYHGTWDDVTGNGTAGGTVDIVAFNVHMTIQSEGFYMPTDGNGTLSAADGTAPNCTDNSNPPGASCGAFTAVLSGGLFNDVNFSTVVVAGNQIDTSTGNPFTPVDGGVYTWTSTITALDNVTKKTVVYQLPITVTLHSQTPAVPVPAAAWLLGSGLLGLIGAGRRRRAA